MADRELMIEEEKECGRTERYGSDGYSQVAINKARYYKTLVGRIT